MKGWRYGMKLEVEGKGGVARKWRGSMSGNGGGLGSWIGFEVSKKEGCRREGYKCLYCQNVG
jgi:hypothetical protein